jgi:hypothetical protein
LTTLLGSNSLAARRAITFVVSSGSRLRFSIGMRSSPESAGL